MNMKHSRGPPWDFPPLVYRTAELLVAVLVAGFLILGGLTTLGSVVDSSFLSPPSNEKAFAMLDWDRDKSPFLSRVRI